MQTWHRPNWQALDSSAFSPQVEQELAKSHPSAGPLKDWLAEQYRAQTGIFVEGGSQEMLDEYRRWLCFQDEEGNIGPLMRSPSGYRLFASYTLKGIGLSQRPCSICHGGRPIDELFPVNILPIRICPISWQATNSAKKNAFKAAIKQHFASRQIAIGVTGRHCIAITFILSEASRDKDCDNMAKGLIDALADTLGFNDKDAHHVDILKLIFPECEDYLTVRIAPSALNAHSDVLAPISTLDWAGQKQINLADFLNTPGETRENIIRTKSVASPESTR
jgi:Holliday junction resolvase RusA-like endonuclease